ncbi:Tripartite ATP-independent periplasmic transporter DctQ component [Caldalkalibacillus thermarum TA2.A1]|uniref:TRAP transporter small permease n=1 Tax=Caldalkalibacillus thermarum (strain TA2.A1) TaxID=986075 RepID=F5L6B0_CALTT|nr:TRAP transporter small permease [Caldalkalibacillus thermarum]EGL83110.1 Tripartite ATP-independent periplasmic transporter DctQ component [Caldalkalibacillus thermarum TA2.A1]QZT32475.1 TRAP transporter small permease [Caldalkalibacillus thermarum TA2.A1]
MKGLHPDNILHRLSRLFHTCSMLILLFMMFLVCADVVGRFFFNRPIRGTFEMTELGIGLLIFFSLSYTHLCREHISIDFIIKKFPKILQDVLDVVIRFIIFILQLLISWKMMQYGSRVMASNQITADLGLPLYPFVYLAAVGALLFALVALFKTSAQDKGGTGNGS